MSSLKDFRESTCAAEGCGRSIWYTSEDGRGWFHWAWAMADHEAVPRKDDGLSYHLGEIAGYRVEPRVDRYEAQTLYLVHECGWEKDLSGYTEKNLLTNIVLGAVQNKHTCKPQVTQ